MCKEFEDVQSLGVTFGDVGQRWQGDDSELIAAVVRDVKEWFERLGTMLGCVGRLLDWLIAFWFERQGWRRGGSCGCAKSGDRYLRMGSGLGSST